MYKRNLYFCVFFFKCLLPSFVGCTYFISRGMYDDCSLLLTGMDFNCMSLTEFWGLKLMCSMPVTCIFHDGYRVFSGKKNSNMLHVQNVFR